MKTKVGRGVIVPCSFDCFDPDQGQCYPAAEEVIGQ